MRQSGVKTVRVVISYCDMKPGFFIAFGYEIIKTVSYGLRDRQIPVCPH